MHTGFAGRLSRVAGAAPDRVGCLNWWFWSIDRWTILAMSCQHLSRGIAGVDHLDQSVVFGLSDGQSPGVLDRDPVDCLLAPIRPLFRFPLVGSPCPFGAVGAGRHGDQVLRIVEIVGVQFALFY